ncbi:hypothetical protein KDH_27260 [Dictyobacter sp. S3.2.2.5]|uniref:Uncharacterized protein n=1 Tax=Dictyobacter halimunensis TaxID=3026934 RepID=A0ABQ6FTX9_9CHLR|nr:hypothetical protein KDH_27260 [Dictyobacter sp. S3.2.2.5]
MCLVFVVFLRRQLATPVIERWLSSPDFVFHTQVGRWTYEHCLREYLHASEEELDVFKQLCNCSRWKYRRQDSMGVWWPGWEC